MLDFNQLNVRDDRADALRHGGVGWFTLGLLKKRKGRLANGNQLVVDGLGNL